MKLLELFADAVVLLQCLLGSDCLRLAFWVLLIVVVPLGGVLLVFAALRAEPDPDDDDVAHLEWLRAESRHQKSQLQEDSE